MSVPYEDRLRQEEKVNTRQSVSRVSFPSSLLAAASMIKDIMDAVDAERIQTLDREAGKCHEDGAAAGVQERKRHRDEPRYYSHNADTQQHSLQQVRHMFAPSPQHDIALQSVPSRRPGRQPRKRGKRGLIHESFRADPSGRKDPLPLECTDLEETRTVMGQPRDVVANERTAAQIIGLQQGPPHSAGRRENTFAGARVPFADAGTRALVPFPAQAAAAGTAAVAGTVAATAAAVDAVDVAPASSSLHSQHPRLVPRSTPIQCIPARSTTRVISSETYLRRLFVTASLAHVLSVDACLPRSVPLRRKISLRAASNGGGGGEEHEGQRGEGAGSGTGQGAGWAGEASGGQGWGRHDEAARIDVGGIHSNSAESNRQIVTPLIVATHESSGLFKSSLPVTLIDSAGQFWSMTYLPNRPGNLHSGRLVDGWETFCSANRLRIGDAVEFTRVEAHEQGPRWHGKELVARVFVLKKHNRNRE